ncbi:MAG: hypothetical protein ACK2U3_05350 [Anaerolineales bacterium]
MSDEKSSELPKADRFEPELRQDPGANLVAIISIIAVAVILLGCMLSCVVVAYMFFSNPPW